MVQRYKNQQSCHPYINSTFPICENRVIACGLSEKNIHNRSRVIETPK